MQRLLPLHEKVENRLFAPESNFTAVVDCSAGDTGAAAADTADTGVAAPVVAAGHTVAAGIVVGDTAGDIAVGDTAAGHIAVAAADTAVGDTGPADKAAADTGRDMARSGGHTADHIRCRIAALRHTARNRKRRDTADKRH